jgi:hypothetical protein
MHYRLNSKTSIREYSGFFLWVAVIATLVWLVHSSSATSKLPTSEPNSTIGDSTLPQSQARQKPRSCNECVEQEPQTIYAPLIQLAGSSGTEINLNCRSAHSVKVTPTFFSRNGESFVGDAFEMLPTEVKTINLKTLMPPNIRGRRDLGGMTLSYTGGQFEMWGQLRLMNVKRGNSVDVTFALSQDRRSAIRNAVWWMPKDGEATLAIGNFGNSPLKAIATFNNGDTEEMEIPPFGTHLIERHSTLSSSVDGVMLQALGSNTDLVATGAVTSQARTSLVVFASTTRSSWRNPTCMQPTFGSRI